MRLPTISLCTLSLGVLATATPAFAQHHPHHGHATGTAGNTAPHGHAAHAAGGAHHGHAARPPRAHGHARGHGRGHIVAEPATPPPDPSLVEARAEYEAGRQAMVANNPTEAIPHFQRVMVLHAAPPVLLALAAAYQAAGRVPEAIASLDQYLRDRPDAPDRVDVTARLDTLRATPSAVTVSSTPPGAAVQIDGHESGATPLALNLPPGHHTVALSLGGYVGATREFDAQPGTPSAVDTVLAAVPPVETQPTQPATTLANNTDNPYGATNTSPPPPLRIERHVTPAVGLSIGIAIAGIAGTAIFGALALADENAYNTNSPTRETYDRGNSEVIGSDIALGVAAAGAIAAAIFYFAQDTEPHGVASTTNSSRARRAHRGVQVLPSPAGLTVHF